MQDEVLWRPRTLLQPVLARWVTRAAQALGVPLSAHARDEIVDRLDTGLCHSIRDELAAHERLIAAQSDGIGADLDRVASERVRHRYGLESKRAAAVYDREHGFPA